MRVYTRTVRLVTRVDQVYETNRVTCRTTAEIIARFKLIAVQASGTPPS